jgi:ATP-dependent protease ClpP protease subunit
MKKPIFGDVSIPSIVGSSLVVETPNFMETVNNRIYFYSDVDVDRVLKLNKTLREMSGGMIVQQHNLSLAEPPPIHLHINSFGGFIFDGLSAMDEILKVRETVPIYTIVDGACASAATLMSVVGSHRQIKQHSFALIHQLSSGYWGKFNEFKDEMTNLDLLMETIRKIYKKYTKVPKKELDKILSHDLWWDAETCLAYGIVDEIIC